MFCSSTYGIWIMAPLKYGTRIVWASTMPPGVAAPGDGVVHAGTPSEPDARVDPEPAAGELLEAVVLRRLELLEADHLELALVDQLHGPRHPAVGVGPARAAGRCRCGSRPSTLKEASLNVVPGPLRTFVPDREPRSPWSPTCWTPNGGERRGRRRRRRGCPGGPTSSQVDGRASGPSRGSGGRGRSDRAAVAKRAAYWVSSDLWCFWDDRRGPARWSAGRAGGGAGRRRAGRLPR